MSRRAHGRSIASAGLALALSIALFAVAPAARASAVPRSVEATQADQEAPACPEGSPDRRDDDDGDDDSFVRGIASWSSASPSSCAARSGERESCARRGHWPELERPPRA